MQSRPALLLSLLVLSLASVTYAQDQSAEDRDELRIVALEALMSAPPDFALPRVKKILEGNNSDEVKESALFVLSQIDLPEAHQLLVTTAEQSSGDLQLEAIEMIGIGGDPEAMAKLDAIYQGGDRDVREAVLEAYLIADDANAIFQIATQSSGDDFEAAVEMLGAMGAKDELQKLRESGGMSEALIEAYALSDDYETLLSIAMDDTDLTSQAQAIEYLGMVGGDNVGDTLVNLYRGSDNDDIKEAALDGLLMADYDEGVLALYREASDAEEKSELLEYLVHMDSEVLWELIDDALEGER